MTHSFHIPVLGLAFSIDTPIKVAHFGISSVISIVDDELIERMREYYSKKYELAFEAISKKHADYRATRICKYLDLVQDLVSEQVERLKRVDWKEDKDAHRYFELLPETHPSKEKYALWKSLKHGYEKHLVANDIREAMVPGEIDVNIMSKVDKINRDADGNELPEVFSDASAAVRGFAMSKLQSSLVLSAGMNPRLYAYLSELGTFFPDADGNFKKKITLKVSDYRSALIQAKYLAKRGIWISEYRIESGLNCGGHAFATDGFLLGPILEEFKNNKEALIAEIFPLYQSALQELGLNSENAPAIKLSVQGGVGTSQEHSFLLDYYNMDAVGWGSPFLLVPEATTVDEETLNNLATATADDFYISQASPLGVPFNNFRKSTAEQSRLKRIEQGKPGFPCTKKYLVSDTSNSTEPVCTASRVYQLNKINELKEQELDEASYQLAYNKIVEKQCLCEGLATPAYLKYGILKPRERDAVAICPGPNTAYFNKVYSLKEMVDHIYGRVNVLNGVNRPSFFINELDLYVKHLAGYINENLSNLDVKKKKYIQKFHAQLLDGINYYRSLQSKVNSAFGDSKTAFYEQLNRLESQLSPLNV